LADFNVTRVSHDKFQVVYTKEADTAPEDRVRLGSFPDSKTPVPCFLCVWNVTMLLDGSIICDCGTQERQGLCCCETMAVIKNYYPEWKGPSHYDISPRWWIYWLKFGHPVGCGQFTSTTEQLLSCEKAGPSFPFPIPDDGIYGPILPTIPGRKRVRNYSVETIDRLVPPAQEQYDFHGFWRTQVVDGLTQDSYINHESLSFCGGEYESNCDDDNSLSSSFQPFARSLEVPLPQKGGNSRDHLKPYLEELFTCLNRLADATQIEKFSKLVEGEVGHLRCIIAQSTQKRRRQVENVTSVNVVVEMRSNNPKRIKGTHHIDHYCGSK
jgi:hypothetical protein